MTAMTARPAPTMTLPIIGMGATRYWTVSRQTAIAVLADQLNTHRLHLFWDRFHRRLAIAPVGLEY